MSLGFTSAGTLISAVSDPTARNQLRSYQAETQVVKYQVNARLIIRATHHFIFKED